MEKKDSKKTNYRMKLFGGILLFVLFLAAFCQAGIRMQGDFQTVPGRSGASLYAVRVPTGSGLSIESPPAWINTSGLVNAAPDGMTSGTALCLSTASSSYVLNGKMVHPSSAGVYFTATETGIIDTSVSNEERIEVSPKFGRDSANGEVLTSPSIQFLAKSAGYTRVKLTGEELLKWTEVSMEAITVTTPAAFNASGEAITSPQSVTIQVPVTVQKSRIDTLTPGSIDVFVQPRFFKQNGTAETEMTTNPAEMGTYRYRTTASPATIMTNVFKASKTDDKFKIRYLLTSSPSITRETLENESYVFSDNETASFEDGNFLVTTKEGGTMEVTNIHKLAGSYYVWMYMDGFTDPNGAVKPVCVRLVYETTLEDLVLELDIDPKKNRDQSNMSELFNIGNLNQYFSTDRDGVVAHYNGSDPHNGIVRLGSDPTMNTKQKRKTGKGRILFTCQQDNDFLLKSDGSYYQAGDTFSAWVLAIDKIAFKVNDPDNISNLPIRPVTETSIKLAATGKASLNYVYTTVTSPIWKSLDPSVVLVKDGILTGVKVGQTDVTATVTEGGESQTILCHVNVVSASEVLALDKTTYEATIGLPFYLTAKGTGVSACKWVIDDPTVLKFEEESMDGKSTAKVIPLKKGKAVISIYNVEEAIVASCSVEVKYAATKIEFANGLKKLSLNQSVGTYQLAVVLTPTDPFAQIQYEVSDTKVATVSDTGLLTLKSPGNTTVTVFPKYNPNNIHATLNLTVTQQVNGIKLDTTSINLAVGKTQKLTYTLNPKEPTIKTVKWNTMNSKIATVKDGIVTAKSPGQTYITVTTDDGKYTANCMVTVTQEATAVKLDVSSLTIRVGDVYYVQTTFTPKNATTAKLTWTSQDPSICTVTNSGKVTGVAPGKTTILVKTAAGEVVSLYVTVQQGVTGLSLDYQEKNVVVGRKFKLTPTFTPENPTNQIVKWESSNSSVASVNEKGKVQTLKPGMTIITCTSEDGGYVAACAVTVRQLITSIKLNKSSYKLGVGKSVQLKATLDSNDVTNPTLKWVSSDNKVAAVDKNGKVTGKKIGRCKITAMAKDGSDAEASCQIQVVKQVSGIRLSLTTLRLIEGSTKRIRASVSPKDATYRSVKWESEDENIATIDSNGNVYAVKEGSCRIYAKAKDNGKAKAYCWVYVTPKVPSTGITISQKDIVMVKGQTEGLLVSVQPANTTDRLRYSSDNKAVAYVDGSGRIHAVKSGVANVTVIATSGQQATAKVTVVGLNKTNITMKIYDKDTLWVEEVTSGVMWQSEDPSVVSVQNGEITSRKPGSTDIIATFKGVRLVCHVTVLNDL